MLGLCLMVMSISIGFGRDSERADEYWVFETARAGNPGRDIGRIQSPTLGQEMNLLTHGASLPQHLSL